MRNSRAGIGRDPVIFFDAFLIGEVELLREAGMSDMVAQLFADPAVALVPQAFDAAALSGP